MTLTLSNLIIIALCGVVAWLGAKWAFKKDTEIENRRRAAGQLAAKLREMGFTELPEFFIDYSVGDYSGMAYKLKAVAQKMMSGEKGVLAEIGDVFDKLLKIKLATQEGRLLVRSVVEAAAARDLSRFFAPETADRITGAEHQVRPGHGEAREASILTVDIRGFTQLAKSLPPSDLIGVLVEYQSRMIPAIQRHGGSIDKFLGDGILATFGAVIPRDTHAADALRALEAVIAAGDAWSQSRMEAGTEPMALGAAVATGRVVFGAVGDESRLEYTVIGDAVNLAAKLEKHNKAIGARALVASETYDVAVSQGYRPTNRPQRISGVEIVGVEGPVELVVLAR